MVRQGLLGRRLQVQQSEQSENNLQYLWYTTKRSILSAQRGALVTLTSQYVEPYSDQLCSFRQRPSTSSVYLAGTNAPGPPTRLTRVGVGASW